MAGYEKLRSELEAHGIDVVAVTAEGPEEAGIVADEVGFPVAHGLTREQAEAVGAWWDEKRGFVQPSEFLLDREGRVLSATYSTGPVGRLDAADALALVKILKSRAS